MFTKPPDVTEDQQFGPWFVALADRLLNGCDLVVAGEIHRLAEVEFYYFGEGHPDAFTHRDPRQRENGRWYFHRTRGEYRGGSFKGLDITFGEGEAFGGVLIRSLVAPDGLLVAGPSLSVDHLLARAGTLDVRALDGLLAGRSVGDEAAVMFLREGPPRAAPVDATARVGLTLKWAKSRPELLRYVLRPYRFLTEPRRIGKGRAQLVLALHAAGHDPAAIVQRTGAAARTVAQYAMAFEEGRRAADFGPYVGKELTTDDLCRLHGVWWAREGGGPAPPGPADGPRGTLFD